MTLVRSILAGAFFVTAAWSQELDWEALLGSADRDPVVVSGMRQVSLATGEHAPYLWKSLQAKWESKRGDLKQQEAGIRLEPMAWGEREAVTRIHNRREDNFRQRLGAARSKALLERYRLGIHWVYQNRQLAYHRALSRLHDDRAKVQSRLSGDPRFDPQDLVNSLQQKVEFDGEALGDLDDIGALEASLRSLAGTEGKIDLDTNLVAPPRIQEIVSRLPGTIDSSFPDQRSDKIRLDIAESKFALERSKARSVLAYLEAGWEWDRTVQSKTDALNSAPLQELSFGAGIRIPLFDGQTSELARSRGDLEAAKGDLLERNRDLSLRYSTLKAEIGSMIRRKAAIDSFTTRVDAGNLFADYAKRADSDPLLVLKARASTLETQWKSEKLRFEILEKFIEILAMTGRLADGNALLLTSR